MNLKEAMAKLESMGDETRRQHNAKAGPDGVAGPPADKQFGVKTGDIRALAKKIKADHELAMQLWKTGNTDAQLLAILLMKPKGLSAKDLDKMVREARSAWVADWLSAYIVKEQPDSEKEALREKWMKPAEKDAWAARAGWNLAASGINKGGKDAGGMGVEALLDRIEKEMPKAPPQTQWTMNNTLIAIGVHHPPHRKRAVAIGEKIGLYKNWPMSKGCVIPYVPVCVPELVKRQG
jgi:3-methyladenine DNA glycosylase AlkD